MDTGSGFGSPRPQTTSGGFRGEHGFLSNFHPCQVVYLGRTYLCSEGAYMAQKCANPEDRDSFMSLDGPSAKRLAKTLPLRRDWEIVRIAHMRGVLAAKFTQNPDLGKRLIATGDLELVEFNTWDDRFWGVCGGVGLNWLGRFLMELRTLLILEFLSTNPGQCSDRVAAFDAFLHMVRDAMALANLVSATELWLVQRLLAAAYCNPDFDLPREEAEVRILIERLRTWSRPMNTPQSILTVTTDAGSHSWQAKAYRRSPESVVSDCCEASGSVSIVQALRKDQDGKEKVVDVPITEVELLGLALDAALTLAQGWGEACILEADTRQNGLLKVSLQDWVRAGRLSEGETAFVYAREAWCRVLEALRQDPPGLRVRWSR